MNLSQPIADPRSTNELIHFALTENDAEIAWHAVYALHWRGTDEVLHAASRLCLSDCAVERRLGADILGQLGVAKRTFPTQCRQTLVTLLAAEREPQVLRAALIGLYHLNASADVPQVFTFATHPDATVRQALVLALTGNESPDAVSCLVGLSRDSESDVRDWATFALGTQIDHDSIQIRDALADRLDDQDFDTRAEALIGLARRKDLRVIAALKVELARDQIGTLAIEAAEQIASNELYPALVALRQWWDVDVELLERAITASMPQVV